jgi:tetraacyldisaccharide 4'-kinase
VLEPFYYVATALRNWRYDNNPKLATNVGVPVISVGNLTVGGTGKTPVVLWLVKHLRTKGLRAAILSRGYGAESSRNDEAMELESRLPDVPHVQHADRIAGAQIAKDELDSQILVLDDAFQHRRIARDFDIVLLDATAPFGYGHLLPRGLLRESLRSLRRAHAVILTRSDLISKDARDSIRAKATKYNPKLIWAEASHAPTHLQNSSSEKRELVTLVNLPIAAFCGIGNPNGFQQTLEKWGAKTTAFRAFPDHYAYSAEDIADLAQWAKSTSCKAIVCTQKDLVKLQIDLLGEIPLFALQIDIQIRSGESELLFAVDQVASMAAST